MCVCVSVCEGGGHAGVAVLHPADRTRPHPTIRRDLLGCRPAHRQPMTAMGLITLNMTRRLVVVPPMHMHQAAYLSSLCAPNMLECVQHDLDHTCVSAPDAHPAIDSTVAIVGTRCM